MDLEARLLMPPKSQTKAMNGFENENMEIVGPLFADDTRDKRRDNYK